METQTPILVTDTLDLVSAIMAYETCVLSARGVVQLFSHLLKTGLAWSFPGFYGRTAKALIRHGYLSTSGDILKEE